MNRHGEKEHWASVPIVTLQPRALYGFDSLMLRTKITYRNLLFFLLQKYFRTQKTYENNLYEYNFTTKIFPTTPRQQPHTSMLLLPLYPCIHGSL